MESSTSAGFEKVRQEAEPRIQRDLALVREAHEQLAAFHARAAQQPELWREADGWEALHIAQELRAVQYELHLFYSAEIRRHQAEWHALTKAAPPDQERIPGPPPVDPERRWRGEAQDRREGYDAAIRHLRELDPDDPMVRLADRERKARLRMLLDLLAEIQPKAAQEIEQSVIEMRARSADEKGPDMRRRERQTADWLALFLEPLLPE